MYALLVISTCIYQANPAALLKRQDLEGAARHSGRRLVTKHGTVAVVVGDIDKTRRRYKSLGMRCNHLQTTPSAFVFV